MPTPMFYGAVQEVAFNVEAAARSDSTETCGEFSLIAAATDQRASDLQEIEASIVMKKAEAEDAFGDATGQLEVIRAEMANEKMKLAAARMAVEAEIEDLKVDIAELRSATAVEVEAMRSAANEG